MNEFGSKIDDVARSMIEAHIDVCTERYGNLWSAVQRVETKLHEVQSRMLTVVTWTCGTALIGLASVAFYFMTHGHP